MPRQTPISSVMTTDVLTFAPDDQVADAMAQLVGRGVDGAPVVDGDGRVVGMLSTGDLIVQDAQLHIPTVISMFGASIELPSSKRHFEEDLRKALAALGLYLRPEDEAATLSTARFLLQSARLVRAAQP